MDKKSGLLSGLILCLATAGALILSTPSGGQESQRGACEQACTKTYQECRSAANANQPACKEAFDTCRKNCKDVKPHPSPSPTASPSPTVSPSPTPEVTPTPTPSPSGL